MADRREPGDLEAVAREVLEIEAEAVKRLAERIDESFAAAVHLLVSCSGTVLVLGVGKSGIVARKIAATLSSTGTRALFLHAADCVHGDIGVARAGDVAIVVSKSGEGEELKSVLPLLVGKGVPVIAITGSPASTLAGRAELVLDAAVEREACPMDLVPTASTTAALALGDALAVALLREKEVDRDDLAAFHPGGLLGRQLALRVRDVMHTGDEMPLVSGDVTMGEAIVEIAEKRLGLTTVVDGSGRLTGILTDGDLKRILMNRSDALSARADEVMTLAPRTVDEDVPLGRALELMETNTPSPITSLVIVDDDGRPKGVVHIHDCLRMPR